MIDPETAIYRIVQIDYALAILDWTPDEKAIWASIKNAYRRNDPASWGRQYPAKQVQLWGMIERAKEAHLQR